MSFDWLFSTTPGISDNPLLKFLEMTTIYYVQGYLWWHFSRRIQRTSNRLRFLYGAPPLLAGCVVLADELFQSPALNLIVFFLCCLMISRWSNKDDDDDHKKKKAVRKGVNRLKRPLAKILTKPI